MYQQVATVFASAMLMALTTQPVSTQANEPNRVATTIAGATSHHKAPQLVVRTVPAVPRPGDVLIVRASVDAVRVDGRLGDRIINFAPEIGKATKASTGKTVSATAVTTGYIALVGLDGLLVPGTYSLTVTATTADGSVGQVTQPIKVGRRASVLERVKLTKTLSATLDPAVNAEETEAFAQIYNGFSQEKRWVGAFKWPVAGKVVALYGNRRAYNGIDLGTYHAGYDLAARKGTPVKAAAAGQVVVVKLFTVHGLTVVVDHGRGVYTTYSHLSKAGVTKGDMVDVGDVLGNVGSTGRSQGPHLHFEVAVGGAPIDPGYWMRVALP
ncbi:MAG: M23 family metallopeptidase [Chloroflexi bacterium]|nr:M23 family metallopeptidase [Chloroflexota bacterium]